MDTPTFDEVRTIGAGSFSRLEDFEKCPHRAFIAHVLRRQRPAPETAEHRERAERGQRLHKLAERYVKGEDGLDLDELKKIRQHLDVFRTLYVDGKVEVEQQWAFTPDWQICEWFAEETWLRVQCDVVLYPGEAHAEVYDYKSGKKYNNEVKHIGQGQLYALSTFVRYPATESVDVDFLYVDHGLNLRRTYKRADVPRLMATWDRRLKRMTSATEFPAKPNKLHCAYCPWSKNNGGDNSCEYGVEV